MSSFSYSDSELKFIDGKYENKLVIDVIKEDPSYCHYMVYKNKNYIPKAIKNLLLKHFTDEDDYYMSFGPFKKKTLKWINENEPEYIEFLKHDDFVKNKCHILYNKLQEL